MFWLLYFQVVLIIAIRLANDADYQQRYEFYLEYIEDLRWTA